MAKKSNDVQEEQTNEGALIDNSGATETSDTGEQAADTATEQAAATTTAKRERRVTTKIKLPEGESTIGSVNLHLVGKAEPIVYPVDFATLSKAVLYAAALHGLSTKFATAYAGLKTNEEIEKAVAEEIALLDKGEFSTRTLKEKVQEVPDVVYAWIAAVGADANDPEVLEKYKNSWNSRDEAGKATVSSNLKVIEEMEKIQSARRLAKKAKSAVQVELDVL